MIVAGGVYLEVCRVPETLVLMGSGGRAAIALQSLSPSTKLFTFHPELGWPELIEEFAKFGVSVFPAASSGQLMFEYLHSMSRPKIFPLPMPVAASPIHVDGRNVLRFGCLEGSIRVVADQAVYDPQGAGAEHFRSNGSSARKLALVLNKREVRAATGIEDVGAAAKSLLGSANAIVVKDGPFGAYVFEGEASGIVPAYETPRVFKIGSGDVFSATFAHYWMERGMSALSAADAASRHTADYVTGGVLPCVSGQDDRFVAAAKPRRPPRILVDCEGDSEAHRWLVVEAVAGLLDLGVRVLAPPHARKWNALGDVVEVADLLSADAMLILTAGGDPSLEKTLALAKARDVPTVVLGGSNSTKVSPTAYFEADFATSLYRSVWVAGASMKAKEAI